ncbi:hypothetical protein D3C71_946380 [compost metagenome]
MIGDNAIGLGEITEIGDTAGDDAALIPPFAGINKLGRFLRRLSQKGRCFGIFLLVAQVFHPREEISRVAAPGGVDLTEERGCGCGALQHGRPGVVKRLRLAEITKTLRLADAAAIHQIVHARLMVGGRQIGGKLGKHTVFHVLVHAFADPELANETLRFRTLAGGGERLGEHHGAFGGFRAAIAEGGKHLGCGRIFAVKRFFGIGAQRRRTRPAGELALGSGNFGGSDILLAGNGDSPGEDMAIETAGRHGVAQRNRAGRITARKRVETGLQLACVIGAVEARYGAGDLGRGRHEGRNSRCIRLDIGKRRRTFRQRPGQCVPNGCGKARRHQSPDCLFHAALHRVTDLSTFL